MTATHSAADAPTTAAGVPLLGGGVNPADRHAVLRAAIMDGTALVVPGVYDALTAVLAERAGFRACYLTGAGLANSQLGAPDVGLISPDMLVTQAARISAVTTIPIIVDCDTGFGGPTSVMRVVRALEAVDVSAVQLEDQAIPKRCGHFEGKRLISVEEMQAKIDAATIARRNDDVVVIARTDAIAVEGLDAAVERAKAYREAGADVLFVEAPDSVETIEELPGRLAGGPLLMNVVPGGKTPELGADRLRELGYTVQLHANLLLRSMVSAGVSALTALHDLDARGADLPFLSWTERQEIVRLPEFDAMESRLQEKWGYRD
jgi:2-methylisocitrate lyase-like PEP mutase family enzyme